MKKILMAAATLMLAVGFVACSKSDDAPVAKDIKIEFSVADKAGFDGTTRAVKSGWADGDKIMLFFKVGGSWLVEEYSKTNTVTLTYDADADKWSAVKNSWSDALTNSTGGNFLAVHYRGDIALGASYSNKGYYFVNFVGGEYMFAQGAYTIADGVMTLPTLAMKMDADMIQFSVKNLASNEDEWELLINHDRDVQYVSDYVDSDSASPVLALNDNIMFRTDNANGAVGIVTRQWMSNVVNGSDRSFVCLLDVENVTTKYVFILKNVTKSKYYKFEYAPSPFAEFVGKTAYVLPELTVNDDGTVQDGCKWKLLGKKIAMGS